MAGGLILPISRQLFWNGLAQQILMTHCRGSTLFSLRISIYFILLFYHFSKKCTQKKFCPKTDLINKTIFWRKTFFGCEKYEYEKTDFLIPHSPYLKKKSFNLLEGTMNVPFIVPSKRLKLFWELFENFLRTKTKMHETARFFINKP